MSFIVVCPNCGDFIEILEINCGIYRHGVFKDTLEPIPPHSRKEECDRYVKEGLIYGCGNPFQVVNGVAEDCDYI